MTLAALGSATVVALIVGGIMAVAPDGSSAAEEVRSEAAAGSVVVTSSRDSTAPARQPVPPAIRPAIPEGRRELSEGMYAIREGQQVTVHFDAELLRTRFDWKFEGIIRSTLPVLFGEAARTALDSVATGSLVRGGDLLTELPERGFPIVLPQGTLRVWPVTRPGRDGPIVVAYRVKPE